MDNKIVGLIADLNPEDDVLLIRLLEQKLIGFNSSYTPVITEKNKLCASSGLKKTMNNYFKDNDLVTLKLKRIIGDWYGVDDKCKNCKYAVYYEENRNSFKTNREDSVVCDSCYARRYDLNKILENRIEKNKKIVESIVDNNPDLIELKAVINIVKNKINDLK